jgi:hypothetical protein
MGSYASPDESSVGEARSSTSLSGEVREILGYERCGQGLLGNQYAGHKTCQNHYERFAFHDCALYVPPSCNRDSMFESYLPSSEPLLLRLISPLRTL